LRLSDHSANCSSLSRKAKGLSQEDLAYEAEVDRSYMGGTERSQRKPSFQTLCTIASTLNVDFGTLTRGLPVKR
jgi:transcriptional regulator with XRE-family HTH domain